MAGGPRGRTPLGLSASLRTSSPGHDAHLQHHGGVSNTDRQGLECRPTKTELLIYRWMLRISWTEHRTEQNTTRQLLGFIVRRKLYLFGHTITDELVKCVIQGKLLRERCKTSYRGNTAK